MTNIEATPFVVGDPLEQISYTPQRGEIRSVATIVQIHPKPENPEDLRKLIDQLLEQIGQDPTLNLLDGENLADNPQRAPRLNRNALYVTQQ